MPCSFAAISPRGGLRPRKLQMEMESCQHIGPLKMATKECSNFSTKWFLTHLQVHSNKMLSRGGLCKMTVASRARCHEKWWKYSIIELRGSVFFLEQVNITTERYKDTKQSKSQFPNLVILSTFLLVDFLVVKSSTVSPAVSRPF